MLKLIKTTVLDASAASVTISNIPQEFKTLKLVYSLRGDLSSVVTYVVVEFNGVSTNRSAKLLAGSGSSAYSGNYPSDIFTAANGSTATASTFSNGELVLPNYSGSTNKPMSISVVNENNGTTADQWLFAGLWSNTSPITSITLSAADGSLAKNKNFVAGSTFFLYGIA